MNILCVFGEHAYGDPARGEGYEYVNFLPTFRRLGHRVSFFESFSREPYADFAGLNRALLHRVEETCPDVVFCVLMQYEVWVETMRLIRKSGPLLVNWSTDDSWKYSRFSRLIAREWDCAVTTYPDAVPWYERDGLVNVFPSQWAANGETLTPPLPAALCRYPVSFVGAAYGNRPAMINALRREGIDVACFGYGWPSGPVEANRIHEIVRESQVSLNFSEGSQKGLGGAGDRQIKARVFEVLGYGGCLLTEQAPDLERYFRIGEEILTFDGPHELVGAVKLLLTHSERRDTVARRGFERVSKDHTYDRRFDELLDALCRQDPKRSHSSIDWPEFEKTVRRHRFDSPLKLLRYFMVGCASLVWGKERGCRVARRLVFEISWRLFGSHTYTAAGWPGRMFYRES